MIGSDAVANFSNYKKEINKFNSLFDTLLTLPQGQQLIENLAHNNFKKMMLDLREKRGGKGLVLPDSYQYSEKKYIEKKTNEN